MLVVDVRNNRTGRIETISVREYENQRNNFLSDLGDCLYVAVNNIYYERPEPKIAAPVEQVADAGKTIPVVEEPELVEDTSGDDTYGEYEALKAKVDADGYAKLKGPEKKRYSELKVLFSD